jgi:hypothetical protein
MDEAIDLNSVIIRERDLVKNGDVWQLAPHVSELLLRSLGELSVIVDEKIPKEKQLIYLAGEYVLRSLVGPNTSTVLGGRGRLAALHMNLYRLEAGEHACIAVGVGRINRLQATAVYLLSYKEVASLQSKLPTNEPPWLIVGFGQVKYMLCLRKEKEGRSLLEGNGDFTVEGKDPFIYAQGRVHIREPGLSRPAIEVRLMEHSIYGHPWDNLTFKAQTTTETKEPVVTSTRKGKIRRNLRDLATYGVRTANRVRDTIKRLGRKF